MRTPLRSLFLLLPLLLAWGSEQLIYEFYLDVDNEALLTKYQYELLGVAVVVALWYWRRMEPVVARNMLLVVIGLGLLLLESYTKYGTPFAYPHVLSKILFLFMIYASYGFYYRRGLPPLGLLVALTFFLIPLNMVLMHPEALRLSGFLANERGLLAPTALLLVLPTLLCLNWYLQRGSLFVLAMFFFGLVMIIYLQHRSVWLTTLMALLVNTLLVRWRVVSAHLTPRRLTLLVVLPLSVACLGGLATVLENPSVGQKFMSSYEDITKADKQGTGEWRIKQMHAYQPLVAERPFTGWRTEGFELPMQFYDPSNDEPMWAWHTGHHFHSFYMDRLFYFGWVGLLLVVVLPFVQVIRRLANPAPLTAEAAALISLMAGLLVFGLSYDWPFHIYAVVGLMLAAAAQPAPVPVPARRAPQPQAAPLLQLN